MNAEELAGFSDDLLNKRSTLLSLWQEMADHFYPERATFTYTRHLGDEFADHLTTSYPLIVRRELGDSFSSMLRPKSRQWLNMVARDEDRNDEYDAKMWLENASKILFRHMYDSKTQFVRATKEGDHDFATFGQCVISIEPNEDRNGVLYRTWHLKDCAWKENIYGVIDTFTRKWSPTAVELRQYFGEEKLHSKVREKLNDPKKCYTEINCRHIVMPVALYDEKDKAIQRYKFMSVYVDVENKHIIERVPMNRFQYVIPRWQTVSGSQYAFSPATIISLPDARLMQSIALTILEAGEKYVNPPVVATQDAVRSPIELFAGGTTWLDADYDERLGDALRPLTQNPRGFPIGMDFQEDLRGQMAKAWYTDKLGPLPMDKEMTAFEVSQLVQDWIRSALPLFEPMEANYNGALCENSFELLFGMGAFGSPYDLPDALRGAEYDFKFESPLHEQIERLKAQKFMEVKQYIVEAMELDPSVVANADINAMVREAIESTGAPTEWLNEEEVVAEILATAQQQQQQQVELEQADIGTRIAKQGAEAQQIAAP